MKGVRSDSRLVIKFLVKPRVVCLEARRKGTSSISLFASQLQLRVLKNPWLLELSAIARVLANSACA